MKTADLIAEAISLPVEARARVVDSILMSLNPPRTDLDKNWALVAERRLVELRTGEVVAVPGDEVFRKIWAKFSASNREWSGAAAPQRRNSPPLAGRISMKYSLHPEAESGRKAGFPPQS